MAKRNKRRNKTKQREIAIEPRMTVEKIAEVNVWLERMRLNADKAISLAERMSPEDMTEDNDLFWALAKYTENLEEVIIKLDDVNKKIYPALVEFDKDIWKNLKGMRSRLAHAFWNIDPKILWSTVTAEIPSLRDLLSTLIIKDHPIADSDAIEFIFKTERLLGLPDVTAQSILEAGSSVVMVTFRHDGTVMVCRVGHKGNRTILINSNFDGEFSMYGR